MQRKTLYILIALCGIVTLVSGYSLIESQKFHKIKSANITIEHQQVAEQKNNDKQIADNKLQTEGRTKIPETKIVIHEQAQTSSSPEINQQEKIETSVSLEINGGTFIIPYTKNMTAEDAMKYTHKKYPQQFWYESIAYGSDLGTFVTSINGTAENYKEKMHWILYINGKKSNKGISTLILNPNDTITWNYEKEIL